MFGFGMGEILTIVGGVAAPVLPSLIARFFVGGGTTFYLFLICGLIGAAGGWYVTKKFWDASEKAAVEMALADKEVKFNTVIQTEYVFKDRVQKVYVKGEDIIHEIPMYIRETVEKACPQGLPNGFVRVHDSAASNNSAGPAADTDADPSGVTLAKAGEVIARNYRSYNVCREQVIGWKAYYACLRKLGPDAKEDDVKACLKAQLAGTSDSR